MDGPGPATVAGEFISMMRMAFGRFRRVRNVSPPPPDRGLPAKIETPPAPSPRAIWLAAAILVLAILAAYHNCFSVPFLLDDGPAITDNPTIRHLSPVWRALSPPVGGATVSGRPLVNLSLALNFAFGGTKVWGYHALNLAVHLLASLTLFGIVRRTLLLKPAGRERFGGTALSLALGAALLWAVHPLQTESVTYVVQRAESLMGLFYLLTLYGFIRGTPSGAAGWYALAIGACLLGMASKEVMVSAPLMVWLYDRTFVAGTFAEALRRRWRVYVGLFGSWLLLAWLVVRTGELGSERAGFHATIAWWPYALTQLWAIVHYLGLSVWPHPLVFDYGTLRVTHGALVLPSALLVATLAAGTLISLRRWPILGFLGCWFFAILAPTSSVIPLAGQTVAEHRMYLPLAAVVLLGLLSCHALAGQRCLLLFGPLALASVLLTVHRNQDYRSAVAIWSDTVAKRPDNARAHNNLGMVRFKDGQVDAAMSDFKKALDVEPDSVPAHNNLGLALLKQGRPDEAILQFQRALAIRPDDTEAGNNLGTALLAKGKVDEAIIQFQMALSAQPGFPGTYYNLGVAWAQKGQVDRAISYYQKALDLQPDYAAAHNNLGLLLLEKGRVDEAIRHYQLALGFQPDDALAHANLGNALFQKGQVKGAIAQLQQALQLQPDYAEAHYNLGNILLQAGRREDAITHYERALEAKPGYAEVHNNLGNALFQMNRLDDARAHYQAALDLRPDLAEAHKNLGILLTRLGRFDEAQRHYAAAAQLAPGDPQPHFLIGKASLQHGRSAEAVAAFREALSLGTNNVPTLTLLARLLASDGNAAVRDGPEAVAFAERANALSGGGQPFILDTLAMAYAEAGRWTDARRTVEQAIKLALTAGEPEAASAMQSRLKLYQSGQPYREQPAGVPLGEPKPGGSEL